MDGVLLHVPRYSHGTENRISLVLDLEYMDDSIHLLPEFVSAPYIPNLMLDAIDPSDIKSRNQITNLRQHISLFRSVERRI